MFQPNASRPISLAWKATGGGRNRLPVSSMMRIVTSGAAPLAQARPDAERLEEADRAVEKRDGAPVRGAPRAGRRGRSRNRPARARARREAGRAGADDGDVESEPASLPYRTGRAAPPCEHRRRSGRNATTARRRPCAASTWRTGRVAPGHVHLGAAAMRPLGEGPERGRRGRVGERHGGRDRGSPCAGTGRCARGSPRWCSAAPKKSGPAMR